MELITSMTISEVRFSPTHHEIGRVIFLGGDVPGTLQRCLGGVKRPCQQVAHQVCYAHSIASSWFFQHICSKDLTLPCSPEAFAAPQKRSEREAALEDLEDHTTSGPGHQQTR